MQATIHALHVSPGGVPKRPVAAAELSVDGLAGDWQTDRVHHGGPDRALCLWSLEVIEVLAAAGHPVFPGATGENLTLAGLRWADVVPGVRLRLGVAAVIEVTDFAAPCRTIQGCFLERRYGVISQKTSPGASRMYARVLTAGPLTAGDPVLLLPGRPS